MKAIRYHEYGDARVLRYEEAPVPSIGADGILIRVSAAGVNPIDCKLRSGSLRKVIPLVFPVIPGADVAGIVERTGALINRFKEGDAVIARAEGTYAEFAAARIDTVARAPSSIPLHEACAIPIAAATAWAVLFESASLSPGRSVLVQGGSGGVGMFAIQLAKLAGLRVLATSSTGNLSYVRGLGADRVIDYSLKNLRQVADEEVDFVFDAVGGETQRESMAILKEGGTLISIVNPPDPGLAQERRVIARRFDRPNIASGKLEQVVGLIDAGKLKIHVDRQYPLEQAYAAHERVEEGHARGKVVLRVT